MIGTTDSVVNVAGEVTGEMTNGAGKTGDDLEDIILR